MLILGPVFAIRAAYPSATRGWLQEDTRRNFAAFRVKAAQRLISNGSVQRTNRKKLIQCHFSWRMAPPATQSRSNPVSGRCLQKTGIFQISTGNYRRIRSRRGQFRRPETDNQLAKARHWRAFLRLPRVKSTGAGLAGWGGRIRTFTFPFSKGYRTTVMARLLHRGLRNTRLNNFGNWLGRSEKRSSTSRHCMVSQFRDAIIGTEDTGKVAF